MSVSQMWPTVLWKDKELQVIGLIFLHLGLLPSGSFQWEEPTFTPCFLFSLLASGGITLGSHFSVLSPDEFGIALVTYPRHCHLAFLFYTSSVLLPQITCEVKLAIKSHNRQITTISVPWEDLIKENCVCFDVVYSKIWVEEYGWTAIEGRLDSLCFAPIAYSQRNNEYSKLV